MINLQSSTVSEINGNEWEYILIEWSRHLPLKNQGARLSAFLKEVMPSELHPLLADISQCYLYPEDTLRWKIFNEAQQIGFSTPVGTLALACFWLNGSMSPIGLEPIYPAPHLSHLMIQCVLIMCANLLADIPTEGVHKLLSRQSMIQDPE
ncbi:DUF6931 family protein [Citrobacter cronae]|uniref:DUF6931 family protein n=1 Tax=Citrobacter cronae TaxID=1748967 RepID=UPI001C0FC420|nr:hypothetical protein [Citrobacter cronae]MBU5388690.1 hypothetical protein [Citrobacter cronae]